MNQFLVLTPKYLLPSQWVPVLLPSYSLPQSCDFLFTLYQGVVRNLFDNVTHFRSGTEIAPKSLFVCVNKALSGMVFMSVQKLSGVSGLITLPCLVVISISLE